MRSAFIAIVLVLVAGSMSFVRGEEIGDVWEQNSAFAHKVKVKPVHAGDESSCMGYKGKRLALRAAPNARAAILGWIKPGDNFTDQYLLKKGWAFTEVFGRGEDVAQPIGWYFLKSGWSGLCTEIYG